MYCSISPCYFVFGFIACCTAPHFGAGSYVLCAVPLSCFPCRLTCLFFRAAILLSVPVPLFFFSGRYPAFSAGWPCFSRPLSCFPRQFSCPLFPGCNPAFTAGLFVPHDYLSFFVSFLVAAPSSPRNNAAESGAGIPSASFPANPSVDKSIKISRHSKRNHKLFFRNNPDSLHPSFRPSRKNRHCDMQNNSWRIINKLIGYMNYIHYIVQRIQLPLHQTQYPPKKLMP